MSKPTFQRRILLAEDEEAMRTYLTRALEKSGYAVDSVDCGTAALPLLESDDYDLLLSDIVMPEMDGIEATAVIRSLKTPVRVPIIAVTANAMTGDREICLRAGMDDYLTKPVASEGLKQMLERFVWEKDDEAV